MSTMTERAGDTLELLQLEEAAAWFEYLEAIRGTSAELYDEAETWAWSKLQQRRRAIATRRAKAKAE